MVALFYSHAVLTVPSASCTQSSFVQACGPLHLESLVLVVVLYCLAVLYRLAVVMLSLLLLKPKTQGNKSTVSF